MKPRIWLIFLAALVIADVLLAATGTGILIRQQHGHGWMIGGDPANPGKRKIPVLGCVYWTGFGTRLAAHPMPAPDQACPSIAR